MSLIESSYFLNTLIELSLIDSIFKNTKVTTDKDAAIIASAIGFDCFGNTFNYKVGGIIKSANYTTSKIITINNK